MSWIVASRQVTLPGLPIHFRASENFKSPGRGWHMILALRLPLDRYIFVQVLPVNVSFDSRVQVN